MPPAPPTIGRVVIYRSRTGRYSVPAIITATNDSLAPDGVEAWHDSGGAKGVPTLTGDDHVHLTVLTPGMPGQRADADDFKGRADAPISENVAGCYQEWDVPYFDAQGMNVAPTPAAPEKDNDAHTTLPDGTVEQLAGTWTWPTILR